LIPDDNPPPPHALFIEWGKFKAGAFGIPAVLSLAIIVAAVVVWRLHA
jgi:hypothetical protein